MHCTMSIVRRPNMRLLWLLRHLWQDLDPCGEPTICPRCNVLIPFCRPVSKRPFLGLFFWFICWFLQWYQISMTLLREISWNKTLWTSLKDIFGLFRTSFICFSFREIGLFVQDLQRALTNAGSDECIIEASYCLDLLGNAINRCQGCSLGFCQKLRRKTCVSLRCEQVREHLHFIRIRGLEDRSNETRGYAVLHSGARVRILKRVK